MGPAGVGESRLTAVLTERALTLLRPTQRPVLSLAGAVLLICWSARPAPAQIYEAVGIRAQGMAGAFVAVADDATATWWNPAGLAGGAYFSSIVEYGTSQDPRRPTDAGGLATPAWRSSTRAIAVAYPALGLSYYRLRVSEIRPLAPTAAAIPDRQDQGRAPALMTSLVLQQLGATFGQSIGEHLVVGTTLKLVRGGFAAASTTGVDASLDRVSELDGGATTHADIDVGAMVAFGRARVGAAVKNLRQPGFAFGAARVDLRRQARVGFAAASAGRTALTIAVDADLTRTATATGDARHVAAGAEAWPIPKRIGVRGGLSANTVGATRLAPSGGISVAVRSGLYLDAAATLGTERARKGWGLDLRLTF